MPCGEEDCGALVVRIPTREVGRQDQADGERLEVLEPQCEAECFVELWSGDVRFTARDRERRQVHQGKANRLVVFQ